VAIRAALFAQLGGLRGEFDGSQDYDLLLRAVEQTARIVHIPDVLYHMRLHPGSLAAGPQSKPQAHERGRRAVAESLQRQGIAGEVREIPEKVPGYNVVSRRIAALPTVSVLIAAEGDTGEEELRSIWAGCEVLIAPPGAPPAEAFNALAARATGEVLLLASGALRPRENWREVLLPEVMREDIGLVGGKLTYHDNRLFSAGLVLGLAGAAGRWHHWCIASDPGYGGWMLLTHEVSALPWHMLALRRELWGKGLDAGFKQRGFDIDLALRLREAGLRHLCLPASGGAFVPGYPESALETWEFDDLLRLWRHWGKVIRRGDPYFNPNFSYYNEEIGLLDADENDLRARGALTAYDAVGVARLGQYFPDRLRMANV
jgi:hypothetical protein